MLTPDREVIRRALGLLFSPGDVFEIRGLDARGGGPVRAGYFDDHGAAVQAAAGLSGGFSGVYVTLNPVAPALLARSVNRVRAAKRGEATSDGDVVARRWLLVDVDPKRSAGISATDEEKGQALEVADRLVEFLRTAGWPDPVRADSGNGYHLLFRVDLQNEPASTALAQGVLNVLADRFDTPAALVDRSVFNAARIVKLYGTLAAKGDSTADRPHRLGLLLSVPDEVVPVPVELLRALAPTPKAKAEPNRGAPRPPSGQGFDVVAWLKRHGLEVKAEHEREGRRVFVLASCPFNPQHGSGSDTAVVQHADGKLGFACKHSSCSNRSWGDLRAKFEPGRTQQRVEPPPGPRLVSLREALGDADRELDAFHAGDFSEYVSTGIVSLDRKLGGGLRRRQVTLLGAPTGGGKTTLLSCIGMTAAERGPVLYVSPEMGAVELAVREIVRSSGVTKWKRRPWNPRPEDERQQAAAAHARACSTLAARDVPLFFMDSPAVNMDDIVSAARRLNHERGRLSLVVIDYAQEVADPDPRTPRYLTVGAVASRSIALADELGAAVVIASQVNVVREGTEESYALRESQILKFKAHFVLEFAVEWEKQVDGSRKVKAAKIRCPKARNGPAFELPVRYVPELYLISDEGCS